MDFLLRSILFVPADNDKYREKAVSSDADAIAFDLEDAVAPGRKEAARDALRAYLDGAPGGRRKPFFVRVNATDSPWFTRDLTVCAHGLISGFLIPKVSSGGDIVFVDRMLDMIERAAGFQPGGFKLIPMIESARGIVGLTEIVSASRRIAAVSFGAYDYRNDMRVMAGATREFQRVPRALLAIAARAAGILSIDTPYFSVKDLEGLEAEKREAAGLGFTGSLIITPSHAPVCNDCFSPGESDIEYARGVLAAIGRAERDGTGIALYDGLMIDAPVRELAEYIRDYVRLTGGAFGEDDHER